MMGCIAALLQSGFTSADFTYTGTYTWVDDGSGNWRLKFLTSGTFTPKKKVKIDVFLVGGGAPGYKGNYVYDGTVGGPGGAGGYTGTYASIEITKDTPYVISVGGQCGASSAFGKSKSGGAAPTVPLSSSSGGSGGGSHSNRKYGRPAGNGGSNGSAGYGYLPGSGQESTTREFGEATGALYAAGGGGCDMNDGDTFRANTQGGDGGGGVGEGTSGSATGGTTNSGSGGGGAGRNHSPGSGGSGIVIIRNARAA